MKIFFSFRNELVNNVQREALEGANTNTAVLTTMKSAADALKTAHKNMDVDEVCLFIYVVGIPVVIFELYDVKRCLLSGS